ncbi:MAG: hypothetical protein MJD61_06465, partial [Proteobacteria bacterium]|nr:hypothetical protein [Pseudomonadota bacterium]
MKPNARRALKAPIALAVGGLALLAMALCPAPVDAGRLKAKVYLTQGRIPVRLTERGLLGFARRGHSYRLRETKNEQLGKRSWKANMVVAFNKAPGDFEFHVLFYDVHDGRRRFVEELSTFVSNRKQRTFIQRLSMPRARFKPNRHMELVVV